MVAAAGLESMGQRTDVILWIVSLKPANSKYRTREQALNLEWDNMGHAQHTASQAGPVGNGPGGWADRPTVLDRPMAPAPSFQIPQKFRT